MKIRSTQLGRREALNTFRHTAMKSPTQPRPPGASRRRHWLCVAYAFPPINRSGTHRTLAFVKHLDRLGWDATVITVEPGEEPLDNGLLADVPESARIIRTPWTDVIAEAKRICGVGPPRTNSDRLRKKPPRMWDRVSSRSSGQERAHFDGPQSPSHGFAQQAPTPAPSTCDAAPAHIAEEDESRPQRTLREYVSRWMLTPDSRIGWVAPAVRAGLCAVRRRRPDVIYSTSPYMSAHLIALLLSYRSGIPWTADFRDPWRDNPFRSPGFSTLERWDAFLERTVLRRATQVICTTPTMTARLCARVPSLKHKCRTIMNGFDAEKFADIEPARGPHAEFVFAHAGQFYGPRRPQLWFAALRKALDALPENHRHISMLLVGPGRAEGTPLQELAAAHGVAANVHVLGRRSHRESLAYLAGSDVLVLAGASGDGGELQVPNKLFEYIALRKPIIAAVAQTSPAVDVLREARAPSIVCDACDVGAMAQAFVRFAQGETLATADSWSGLARFDRKHRASELANVFESISATGKKHKPSRSRVLGSRMPVGSVTQGISALDAT